MVFKGTHAKEDLKERLHHDSSQPANGRSTVAAVRRPDALGSAWPEIAARVRSANRLGIFLDFDGTLVKLRRRPGDVRVPGQTQEILAKLAADDRTRVAIVSGRRLRDIKALLPIGGLRYIGLHGAEHEDSRAALSKKSRRALAQAKREARAELGVLPGIWLEDKVLSLAVHYRDASPAIIREADANLLTLVAPLRSSLTLLNGEKVWEILPQEISGKGATVRALLERMPRGTLAIYVGDDESDESAFAALSGQITIQVGKPRATSAHFHLAGPREVVRFLSCLEKEIP